MRVKSSRWLLIFGGTILTLDPLHPRVEALLARDGEIVATGSRDDIESFARWCGAPVSEQVRLDLEGATAVPGFIDAHIHLMHWVSSLDRVALTGVTSQSTVVARVSAAVQVADTGSWVQGWGWDHSLWDDTDGGFPDTAVLDAIDNSRSSVVPIALRRKDGHMVWLNSRALHVAGIGPDTVDPPGGVIGRDVHGQPNGLLFENAMDLVDRVIPPVSPSTALSGLRRHIPDLHRLGLTGLHIPEGRGTFQALQTLDAAGELALRVSMMLPGDMLAEALATGVQTGFGSAFLKVGHVKFFVDGSLGSETAAMFEPFIGSANNVGVLTIPEEHLLRATRQAIAGGIAPAVHAIGDRANRVVLDVFAQTRDEWMAQGLRPRIEHVQILHPADVARFGALGVVASAQPIHATQDMDLVDRLWGARGRYAYAFATLLATGATLAFGSDAPVETPDPLQGLVAAVTRQRPNGDPVGGWYAEERLTVGQTLSAYMTGAAWASGDEGRLGELTPGARADLTILTRDPLAVAVDELGSIRVCATIVDGNIVFRE